MSDMVSLSWPQDLPDKALRIFRRFLALVSMLNTAFWSLYSSLLSY